MDVYLIRHAEAAELDNEIVEEGFRYITPFGRKRAISAAKKIKELGSSFDIIYSSPLVRAVQTAEVFANAMGYKGEIKTAIELMGGVTFNRFLQLLRRNNHCKSIALFAHAPDVNTFAVKMLKHNDIHELKINFRNSSVCKITFDLEKEEGEFCWFLKSDTLEVIKD
jgi:phosphohistidine phosphatase